MSDTDAVSRPARLVAVARRVTVHQVATGAFAVVALVAAVISYDHVAHLTDDWWAWILPFSLDGLLVAGSLALWIERSANREGGKLAWCSTVLGLLASLAANVASADPSAPWTWGWDSVTAGRVVALWPPLALALAFELLVRIARTSLGEAGDGSGQVDQPAEARTVADAVAEQDATPAGSSDDTRPVETATPVGDAPDPGDTPDARVVSMQVPPQPRTWTHGPAKWRQAIGDARGGMGRPRLKSKHGLKDAAAHHVLRAVKQEREQVA